MQQGVEANDRVPADESSDAQVFGGPQRRAGIGAVGQARVGQHQGLIATRKGTGRAVGRLQRELLAHDAQAVQGRRRQDDANQKKNVAHAADDNTFARQEQLM